MLFSEILWMGDIIFVAQLITVGVDSFHPGHGNPKSSNKDNRILGSRRRFNSHVNSSFTSKLKKLMK